MFSTENNEESERCMYTNKKFEEISEIVESWSLFYYKNTISNEIHFK